MVSTVSSDASAATASATVLTGAMRKTAVSITFETPQMTSPCPLCSIVITGDDYCIVTNSLRSGAHLLYLDFCCFNQMTTVTPQMGACYHTQFLS